MNFDLNNPYEEFESDDIPYSLYEIEGVRKIMELKRQFQTFWNYKINSKIYRYRSSSIISTDKFNKEYKESKRKFKKIAYKLIKLLQVIKGNEISFENGIRGLLDNFMMDESKKTLLENLNRIIKDYFQQVHVLSERIMYFHPKFLNFILKLTQEACKVMKIMNKWSLGFFDELRENYRELQFELSNLLSENDKLKIENDKMRRKEPLGGLME